ncbi:MAG TPA: peptidoglycan DD-metalloendopeptidase family protein [Blastocatellia bacterium]|nr:peptidoglycan DD-metalloendopeptidase family protein [Blastocatellia bacterium]
MTITRKQFVVAFTLASFISTGTASAQQATTQTNAARSQSVNQVVGSAETKPAPAASERPGVVTFAPPTIKTEAAVKTEPTAKTEATPKPANAPAFDLAIVIPAAPTVVKRSATAVEVPAVKREATTLQIPYDLFPELKPNAKAEPRVEARAEAKKVEPKYEARPVISTAQVGSTFGYRSDPFTGRARFHAGCDIKARWGESVGASLGGLVQYAGWYHGYGNLVIVNHGGGVTTHYAHLSSFDVAVGQRVERGQIVGRAGSTGRATSAHLHYELRVDGNPVNPFQPLALDPASDYFRQQAAAPEAAAPAKADVPKPAIELMRVP